MMGPADGSRRASEEALLVSQDGLEHPVGRARAQTLDRARRLEVESSVAGQQRLSDVEEVFHTTLNGLVVVVTLVAFVFNLTYSFGGSHYGENYREAALYLSVAAQCGDMIVNSFCLAKWWPSHSSRRADDDEPQSMTTDEPVRDFWRHVWFTVTCSLRSSENVAVAERARDRVDAFRQKTREAVTSVEAASTRTTEALRQATDTLRVAAGEHHAQQPTPTQPTADHARDATHSDLRREVPGHVLRLRACAEAARSRRQEAILIRAEVATARRALETAEHTFTEVEQCVASVRTAHEQATTEFRRGAQADDITQVHIRNSRRDANACAQLTSDAAEAAALAQRAAKRAAELAPPLMQNCMCIRRYRISQATENAENDQITEQAQTLTRDSAAQEAVNSQGERRSDDGDPRQHSTNVGEIGVDSQRKHAPQSAVELWVTILLTVAAFLLYCVFLYLGVLNDDGALGAFGGVFAFGTLVTFVYELRMGALVRLPSRRDLCYRSHAIICQRVCWAISTWTMAVRVRRQVYGDDDVVDSRIADYLDGTEQKGVMIFVLWPLAAEYWAHMFVLALIHRENDSLIHLKKTKSVLRHCLSDFGRFLMFFCSCLLALVIAACMLLVLTTAELHCTRNTAYYVVITIIQGLVFIVLTLVCSWRGCRRQDKVRGTERHSIHTPVRRMVWISALVIFVLDIMATASRVDCSARDSDGCDDDDDNDYDDDDDDDSCPAHYRQLYRGSHVVAALSNAIQCLFLMVIARTMYSKNNVYWERSACAGILVVLLVYNVVFWVMDTVLETSEFEYGLELVSQMLFPLVPYYRFTMAVLATWHLLHVFQAPDYSTLPTPVPAQVWQRESYINDGTTPKWLYARLLMDAVGLVHDPDCPLVAHFMNFERPPGWKPLVAEYERRFVQMKGAPGKFVTENGLKGAENHVTRKRYSLDISLSALTTLLSIGPDGSFPDDTDGPLTSTSEHSPTVLGTMTAGGGSTLSSPNAGDESRVLAPSKGAGSSCAAPFSSPSPSRGVDTQGEPLHGSVKDDTAELGSTIRSTDLQQPKPGQLSDEKSLLPLLECVAKRVHDRFGAAELMRKHPTYSEDTAMQWACVRSFPTPETLSAWLEEHPKKNQSLQYSNSGQLTQRRLQHAGLESKDSTNSSGNENDHNTDRQERLRRWCEQASRDHTESWLYVCFIHDVLRGEGVQPPEVYDFDRPRGWDELVEDYRRVFRQHGVTHASLKIKDGDHIKDETQQYLLSLNDNPDPFTRLDAYCQQVRTAQTRFDTEAPQEVPSLDGLADAAIRLNHNPSAFRSGRLNEDSGSVTHPSYVSPTPPDTDIDGELAELHEPLGSPAPQGSCDTGRASPPPRPATAAAEQSSLLEQHPGSTIEVIGDHHEEEKAHGSGATEN